MMICLVFSMTCALYQKLIIWCNCYLYLCVCPPDSMQKLILYRYYYLYQKLIILTIYQKLEIFLGLIKILILSHKVGAKIENPNSLILRHNLYEIRPFPVLEDLT